MKYFRLFELQNQYPDIRNYQRENTISAVNSLYNHGDTILKGIYPQNERRFPLSNIAYIRPVANTTMRFILKVKKSFLDEFPRYFTSFDYFSELEQSIMTSNPYFLNLSLLNTNIVEFDLSDSINAFKNQMESEELRNIKVFKNNFLKIIDETSKDDKTTTYGSDPKGVVIENDTFSENTIANTGIAGGILSQSENKNTNNEAGNGFMRRRRNRLTLPTDQINPNSDEKPVSEIEKMVGEVIENPYLDLVDEEGKIYVDYRDLCYYLSWCLSSPTLDAVENNGVLEANTLWKIEHTQKTNNTEKQDNPSNNSGDGVPLEPTGKYFEYDIIRLTIPATMEQSKMMFRNQAGEMQEIQTDAYGLVGRFCCEENSWSGNHYIYQKSQIGPCNTPSNGGRRGGGGGRPREYGYSNDYDVRIGGSDFINQQRDFSNNIQ